MATTINAGRVRFVSRGTYNNSTQYYLFDLVDYNGSSYIAKENTLGNLPTNTQYWQLIAEKGNTGSTGQTGPVGPTGNGISSITKTSTSGLVDTYTITYTNGNTTTFTVTNGEDTDIKANYYNKTETDEKLESKQDKLIAGTGIEITGENIINNIQGNYSTKEVKIGTWINGKPLYRKVVNAQFGTVEQGTETTVEVNLKNVDFVLVDKYWLDRLSENQAINQGYVADALYLGYTSFSDSNTTLRFRTKQSWASNTAIYAIIIYTKTTD